MDREDLTCQLLKLQERLSRGDDIAAVYAEARQIKEHMPEVPGYLEDLARLNDYRDDPAYNAWDEIEDAWIDACVSREMEFHDHVNAIRSSTPDIGNAAYVLDVARRRSHIATMGPVATPGLTTQKLLEQFDETVTRAINLAAAKTRTTPPQPDTHDAPENKQRAANSTHTRSDIEAANEAESAAEQRLDNARTALAELEERIRNLTAALGDVRDELTGGVAGTGATGSPARERDLQQRAAHLEQQLATAYTRRAAAEREADLLSDTLIAARTAADAANTRARYREGRAR